MKMENEMSVSRHVELRIKGGSVYFFAGLAVCVCADLLSGPVSVHVGVYP